MSTPERDDQIARNCQAGLHLAATLQWLSSDFSNTA